jgi:carbon-monoxide dehydrogenase small subunit
MEAKLIHLTVNGRDEAVVIDPLATLQDVLRDKLELSAVKSGCGQGGCGSCSVLVDGALRLSCLTLAERVEGCEVTTLEGLNDSNAIVPLQQAFVENYAAQCGYCTAGMVMAAKALLDRNPAPNRDEIVEGLSGNLCRCTGFAPIVRAVQQAAQVLSDTGEEAS